MSLEVKSEIPIEIIIPVLMPSPFLEPMRKKMREVGETCRVNFVLDFAAGNTNLTNEEILEASPNERFFRGSFGSPGRARNQALAKCEGKYVCFWDVDDMPEPKVLMDFLEILESTQADLGIASWTTLENPMKTEGTSPLSFVKSPGIWRIVFYRDLIENMRFTDLQWGEDQLFIAEALSKNPKIVTYPNVMYRYNQRSLNSQTTKKQYVQDLSESIKYQLAHASEAQGITHSILRLMIFKQLYTVLKFAGPHKAFRDLMMVLSPSYMSDKKIKHFFPFPIWRNRW